MRVAGKKSIEIKCTICNHNSKDSAALSSHLRRAHSINTNDDKISYILKYDNANNYYCLTGDGTIRDFKRAILAAIPVDEKCYKLSKDKYTFIKALAGKFHKFRALADYLFIDLGLTQDIITKEIVENNKPKFTSTTLDFFMKKTNGDLEEAKKLLNKRQSTTSKESFIKRFGEIEGVKQFESHFKNIHAKVQGQSYNSLDSFIVKYGEVEGISKFRAAKELGAHTLDNFIRKYGVTIGTEKYNSWKASTARTLVNFQKTYGVDEGEERYKKYRSKFGGTMGKASNESMVVFQSIVDFIISLGLEDDLYIGVDGYKEYFLFDKKNDIFYLYDFTLREAKIIIEYNGIAYHPRKEKLSESEWLNWKEPYSKMTADEKFENDQRKIKFAEKQGFKVLEIWSDDSVEYNISIIKQFLKVNILN